VVALVADVDVAKSERTVAVVDNVIGDVVTVDEVDEGDVVLVDAAARQRERPATVAHQRRQKWRSGLKRREKRKK
jgi:hypothetical protein